jgi:hypothetical protein
LIEAPPATNVLELYERLKTLESSLDIKLKMGINGLNPFLFQARVPSMSSPL